MRRYLCILLVLSILFSLFGCRSNDFENPIVFYYLRKTDTFDSDDSVIAHEIVEGSRYSHISLVLSAYFQGPQDSTLESPFPAGTYLLNTQKADDILTITLSREFASLSGVSLSLACCALAKTVMEYTGVSAVQIQTLSTLLDGDASIVIRESDRVKKRPRAAEGSRSWMGWGNG